MIKLNNQEIQFETFPNGETRMKKEGFKNTLHRARQNIISFKYENDSDLIRLMFVKNYLDTHIELGSTKLIMYYMPYSRNDRSENNSPFTLKYISNFINILGFNEIEVLEPHSDVSCALLNNARAKSINFSILEDVLHSIDFSTDSDYIVFPDVTSNKRYGNVKITNQLTGIKHRNFETGKIESLELLGKVHNKSFKALLIDDLCSYGGTFLLTAEKLKELGASEIYLLVGHCEDSIFKGNIFETDLIDKVFTTNSLLMEQDFCNNLKYKDRLKVYDIEEVLSNEASI